MLDEMIENNEGDGKNSSGEKVPKKTTQKEQIKHALDLGFSQADIHNKKGIDRSYISKCARSK